MHPHRRGQPQDSASNAERKDRNTQATATTTSDSGSIMMLSAVEADNNQRVVNIPGYPQQQYLSSTTHQSTTVEQRPTHTDGSNPYYSHNFSHTRQQHPNMQQQDTTLHSSRGSDLFQSRPQHELFSLTQHRHENSCSQHGGTLQYHHHQPQQQQQQQQRHHHQQHPHRPQMSPNFHSRSSPIAIIHNPEDAANQAKIRFQHPMYDTSDDEMDDDDGFGGVSVEALTSPQGSTPSAPQSLPTSLLKAPKLGSMPSQDYRLQHLGSLPPPLCLNGEIMELGATGAADLNLSGSPPSTANQKPKFFSSYGSLRESHLTGRFGTSSTGANSNGYSLSSAASKGIFNQSGGDNGIGNEPPATLIAPRVAAKPMKESEDLPGSQEKPPSAAHQKNPSMSIRDRMIQKVQQQREEMENNDHEGETKRASSSLSAMLEASEQSSIQSNGNSTANTRSNNHGDQSHNKTNKNRRPLHAALPESMAQAVAISYSSNLNLFATTQRQREAEDENYAQSPQDGDYQPSAMLSSSMTGLEVLRRSRPPAQRPTSLSSLQDSARPRSATPLLRPSSSNGEPPEHTFQSVARTMSEPGYRLSNPPRTAELSSGSSNITTANGSVPSSNVHDSLSSPALAREASRLYNIPNVVRTKDGRTLIPPRSSMQQPATGLSTLMSQSSQPQNRHSTGQSTHQGPAHDASNPATQVETNSQFLGSSVHFGDSSLYVTASTNNEDLNPDTEGAFDMDLE